MRSKCSFILKVTTSLVLALLMVLGSVSSVIGAVVSVDQGENALALAAKKGFDIAETGREADLASTGATYYYRGVQNSWGTTSLSAVSGHSGYYYFKVTTTGDFKITISSNWDETKWNSSNIKNDLGDISLTGSDNINIPSTGWILFNPTQNSVWAVKNDPTLAANSYYFDFADSYFNGTSRNAKYGWVYYDNTTANWSGASKIYFVVGHDTWIKAYEMEYVSGTNLYGVHLSDDNGFGDAKYYAVVSSSSALSGYTSSVEKNIIDLLAESNVLMHSKLYTSNSPELNNSNNTYPFTSSSSGNNCTLSGTWSSTSHNEYFNKTQTIKVYLNKSTSTTGGNVTANYYSMNSDSVGSTHNSSSSLTSTSNSIYAAKTSSVKLTATPKSGYVFEGFYSDSSLSTKITSGVSGNSYTYSVSDIKTVYVNFTRAAANTITYSGSNVTWVTNPASAYAGDTVSFTVTPNSGYAIVSVKYNDGSDHTLTAGSNNTYSFTMPAKNVTVSVTASKVYTVTAKTNKSSRGTITVDKSTAAKDEDVTITITPAAGILKTLTATYTANNTTYENTVNNGVPSNTWNKVTETSGAAALSKAHGAADLAQLGASIALAAVGASQTVTMKMQEASAVTINATFDTYSGESNYYYNGYDTGGNAVTNYYDKQMTEGILNGEKFSYYHVEGRTEENQLFTVSLGHSGTSNGKVYFTRPGSGDWNQSNVYAYFWKNGGSAPKVWPGYSMNWSWNNDFGQGVYSVDIPTDVDRVTFNDNGTHQTVDIDLTESGGGAYYWDGTEDGSGHYNVGTWSTGHDDQGLKNVGTEYFYETDSSNVSTIYSTDENGKSIFNTTGFYRHGVGSTQFAKPNGAGNDYYINVLYPGNTYTINNVTKKIGNDGPVVVWSTEPLAGDDENVTVYAKDGAIRSETYGSTYANIADTKIYASNGSTTVGTKHSGNITNQTWETYKGVKGDTIVIKTQIGDTDSSTLTNAADLKAKYYVRGFCVNGEVSQLLEWNADGLYTLSYKIPEDYEGTKIEITPIYYLKNTTDNPIVTYRVTGFTDELKAIGEGKPNWGDTLYTYPFYGKLGSNNNALGAYPGQPMVYYKGQYQMQIPQKSTAWDIYYDDENLSGSTNVQKETNVHNTYVSGVTMSNGYYDIVHRQVMGYGSNGASADHVQTYDYGDFYKIFNEKKPVDNIVFDFKYRTKKHNFENQPGTTITRTNLDSNYGTNGNGFELLTNFHGRTVDLFGTPLSGDAADPSKTTPVYVISIGGVNGSAGVENIAGYYATEWMVYGSSDGSSYSRISAGDKSSIPPEVLVLNDDDTTSFNTTTYPSADANHTIENWKALYTALEAYRGKPVMISYEAADAQIGAGNYATSGGGGATRNDGRWLYSKNGENITSKIKIQYSDDGKTYTDNPAEGETGHVTGLSAYFTNTGVEGQMTYATTIDPDKTFDFEAKTTNAQYKFVGWFMEDGTKITTDNASHTERSGSYTFIARFKQVGEGDLIISHVVGTDTTHTGGGSAKIAVVVKDADGNPVKTFDETTSSISLDKKYINTENALYTIDVTLTAVPAGEDQYSSTALTTPANQESKFFYNPGTEDTRNFSFKVGDLFTNNTQTFKTLVYTSMFTKTEYEYEITYQFNGRLATGQSFKRKGTMTANELKTYVDNHVLSTDFLTAKAPEESNIGEILTWDFSNVDATQRAFKQSGTKYVLNLTVSATQANAPQNVTSTFKLDYAYNTYGYPTDPESMTKSTQADFVLSVPYGTITKVDQNKVHTSADSTYDNTYVTAPKVLVDDGNNTYFQYWKVESTASDRVIAKCYSTRYNFVAFENCIVTPVYASTKYDKTADNDISTSITFFETTRNQWNYNGQGTQKENAVTRPDVDAADLLFNDFVISYNYKGKDIYSGDAGDNVNVGFVVQRIGLLEDYGDGTLNSEASYYEEKYKSNDATDAIKTFVATGNKGNLKLDNISIANSALDNKDRVQWFYSVYQSQGWKTETEAAQSVYPYKNYVYRAYSYVKNGNSASDVTLSDPVYFTMYKEAIK